MKFTKENAAELGRRGGQATVAKHGNEHMQEIGRKGFVATTKRYFHGSEFSHIRFLINMGKWCYFQMSNLPMKRGPDGQPIWPEEKPTHPAHIPPEENLPF